LRAPGHEKRYQVYFRDPLTRKFVAIEALTIDTEVVHRRFNSDQPAHHKPKLRRGIPSMSYRGNPIWAK
jgi:hypothetical protein